MAETLTYAKKHDDSDWGSSYLEIQNDPSLDNISICHVSVTDIKKISHALAKMVMDQSWIMNLEPEARRSYESAVKETAQTLQETFEKQLTSEDRVVKEFGEIMVSIGASRALATLFDHISIPIAELWKPKAKQNEGFDFHTVCPRKLINFGEAKFSGSSNPYGGKTGTSSGAGGQADGFISADKHLRDGVHLSHLAGKDPVDKLNKDHFGIILAFSLNSQSPLNILEKAIETVRQYSHLKKAQKIYLVGVSHALKG